MGQDIDMSMCVDISELMEKLQSMLEDEFTTVKLDMTSDGYTSELMISAVGIEDDTVSYGAIAECSMEL